MPVPSQLHSTLLAAETFVKEAVNRGFTVAFL